MSDAMISIPVGKYNELADLVVELTTRHKALIETNESLAARLAGAEARYARVLLDKEILTETGNRLGVRAEAAEARVRELEANAEIHCKERCTDYLRESQQGSICGLIKRDLDYARATDSARAVQEDKPCP